MVDTSAAKGGPSSSAFSLALLFVLWYAFNAYYNVSNKMVVKIWFFPYSCAFLQVSSNRAVLDARKG